MKQRIAYVDFLRGLATMMVVGIHTYSQDGDSVEIRQLLNAVVSILCFIYSAGMVFLLFSNKVETLFSRTGVYRLTVGLSRDINPVTYYTFHCNEKEGNSYEVP